jgi:hypothetical protein
MAARSAEEGEVAVRGAPRVPGTDSSLTHRWREPDSNFWSLNQSSSAVLTPDAMAGISVMFVIDAHLA